MTSELQVLLVEDNPGDARLIEEMFRESEELAQRTDAGGVAGRSIALTHDETLEAALESLSDVDVDVVLLDLNLPDSAGLDTLESVVDATEMLPVVVLTGLDDRHVGVQAIEHGAQDYLVKDNVTGDLLTRSIHYAIERNRQERDRARRREQLEALNQLNRIVQDVTHSVITTSTREDLEREVCDRLVASDAYRAAWIGETTGPDGRVSPHTSTGIDESALESFSSTVADSLSRAVDTHAVQVARGVRSESGDDDLVSHATEHGYRSFAVIPVVYADVVYGVLCVYAASPTAFSEPEADILSRLGDVIGHAITAIERKEALVSDTVLELEFRVDDLAADLRALTTDTDAAIRVENVVHGDADLLAYGRAEGVERETFTDVAQEMDEIDDLRVLHSGSEEFEFELVTTVAISLFEALATHGASVDGATIRDGEFRMTVASPQGRDTRTLVELVEDHCPNAVLLAQRTGERSDGDRFDGGLALQDRLTEKQRRALETAYRAGHFEWPRESTGEEIADRLGVSSPTFHQHLRAAERKLLDAVFEE